MIVRIRGKVGVRVGVKLECHDNETLRKIIERYVGGNRKEKEK